MRGRSRAAATLAVAVLTAAGLAACQTARGTPAGSSGSQGGSGRGAAPVARCGEVRTAAGVPVEIEVQRGPAGCATALAVERAYTRTLASGKVPGNGGGAPVTIRGWVCQGFDTPKVLATGQASACHKGSAEILAVLPAPAASP